MHYHNALAVAGLLVCSSSLAQTTVRSVPRVASGTLGTRTVWVTPQGMVGQNWFHGSNLNKGIYTRIGLKPSHLLASPAATWNVTLRGGNTQTTWATFRTTPGATLGPTAPVLFTGRLTLPAVTPPITPNFAIWMRMPKPFVFLGPHLVIDISFQPIGAKTNYNCAGVQMTSNRSLHLNSVTSCGGLLTAAYNTTLNQYLLTATGTPPTGPVFFMLGSDNVGTPAWLPLSLNGVGMTGCQLGVLPLVLVPSVSGANGTASLTLPWNAQKSPITVFAQAVHTTTANPAGLATTGVVNSLLGSQGMFNFIQSVPTVVLPPATNASMVWVFAP